MGWKKKSKREDKQGGTWSTYEDTESGERIQIYEKEDQDTAVFKDGKKVNRKKDK